jgi:TP53 regulating kinase-like protein
MEGRWDLRLIKKGAEANLYLSELNGKPVLIKRRVEKSYRLGTLDRKLRSYRTIHEAQLIHEAKSAGVPTPIIYLVDEESFTIVMEYIVGERLKEIFNKPFKRSHVNSSRLIGKQVALLHRQNIIHGDLTTSNMILTEDGKLYFIDFGLGYHSNALEDRGVDLYLLKRALTSTHHRVANRCFKLVLEGYKTVLKKDGELVTLKIREIERRGRYHGERM